jgi:hypothetical protein
MSAYHRVDAANSIMIELIGEAISDETADATTFSGRS